MTSRISVIFTLLLITLFCVGLVEGGYLLFENFILKTIEIPVLTDKGVQKKNAEPTLTVEKKNDYRIILQRNLFGPPPNSGKQDSPVVQEKKEEPTATNLDIVLVGSITGTQRNERAIIFDKKTSKQQLFEVGDSIQGALVKEIFRGKVILSYNGKDQILDLSEAAKVRPPPPPINTAPPVIGQGGVAVPEKQSAPAIIGAGQPVPEVPLPQEQPNIVRDRKIIEPKKIPRPVPPIKKQ